MHVIILQTQYLSVDQNFLRVEIAKVNHAALYIVFWVIIGKESFDCLALSGKILNLWKLLYVFLNLKLIDVFVY